jgi:hypothetical protein
MNKRKKKNQLGLKKSVDLENSNSNDISNSISNSISIINKNRNQIIKPINISNRKGFFPVYNKNENKDNHINNMSFKEINELSYFKAKDIDKRRYFDILFSILVTEIKLTKNIICPEDYANRYLLFNIYLLSIYIDLFMNCLLYNDYAISQKYHCSGKLKFITSLAISLLSKCFSSILTYFIDKLTDYPSFVDTIIKEFKTTKNYLYITAKLMRYMEFKIHSLLILELLLGLFMLYYTFIFNTIYSQSINSFLLNFLYSQFESILYSLCISLIISALRKISLSLKNKNFYVISMYIYEHF